MLNKSKMKKIIFIMVKNFFGKGIFIKDYSSNVKKKIKEELDFVYRDGNYKFKFVKDDIENYFKKIKKREIIGGHDISPFEHPEVFNAVITFAVEKNLQIHVKN